MRGGIGLGTGLIIAGAVLGGIAFLWLLVNLVGGQTNAGGFVLGLLLIAILAVPLVVFGLSLRGREAVEAVETAGFAERRRLLDGDRLFRDVLAGRLSEAISQIGPGGAAGVRASLQALLAEITTPIPATSWLSSSRITAEDAHMVEQFDDILSQESRELSSAIAGAATPEGARALDQVVRALRARWDQRQDLLIRGRRPASADPSDLLRGSQPGRVPGEASTLQPGDAVSYEGDDYSVVARLAYFVDGQTWRGFTLRRGDREQRLLIRPNGEQVMLAPSEFDPTPPDRTTAATVSIASASGNAEGVVIRLETREANGELIWRETWSDHVQNLRGRRLLPEEVQFWPRASGGSATT